MDRMEQLLANQRRFDDLQQTILDKFNNLDEKLEGLDRVGKLLDEHAPTLRKMDEMLRKLEAD